MEYSFCLQYIHHQEGINYNSYRTWGQPYFYLINLGKLSAISIVHKNKEHDVIHVTFTAQQNMEAVRFRVTYSFGYLM